MNTKCLCLTVAVFWATAATARAEDAAATADQPEGILPVPDYSGDLWTRNRLTGDWGGTRTQWANKGIQLDVNFTQTLQSVVDGGRDTTTQYGGSLDYLLTLDLMRMGVMPGALVKFRAESRYGGSVNGRSGSLLPVNTDAFFPLESPLDEDIGITVTNLVLYQFFSESFGVLLGKIDTLDGDPNEFASGRGTSQFMNANFTFPTSPLLMVPYSTLAAGIVWMPTKGITVTSIVYNTDDSSTTSGFDDFGDGTGWLTEAHFQYRLGHLPGGMNLGLGYSFDNDFVLLGERFIFQPGQGISLPDTDETWAVYWSAWQYLFVEEAGDAPIQLLDGQQDLQGIGLFLRAGTADDDTSPLSVSISGGIGARGIIPGRDNDTCGIAYYYMSLRTGRLAGIAGIDDSVQGFEAYYNLAITPAARLTFDVQVVESAQTSIDTAVILGLRLDLRF